MKNLINWIIILLILFIVYNTAMVGANFIPWYTQEDPMTIDRQAYNPGDSVTLTISRRALVDLTAWVTAELIRLDGEVEVEVYKKTWKIVMGAGRKTLEVDWLLPSKKQCPWLGANTFIWKGAIEYQPPLGLPKRLVYFKSEKFHIEAPDA